MSASGIYHFAQAQLETLRQERIQQANLVAARGASVQMRESFGEVSVVVDLCENIGDPRVGQTAVKVEHEVTGLLDPRRSARNTPSSMTQGGNAEAATPRPLEDQKGLRVVARSEPLGVP